jgi:glucokinase
MSEYAIGIDLGGTNLKAGVVSRKEGILSQRSIPTPVGAGPSGILDAIAKTIQDLTSTSDRDIGGVGIGSPGTINWERTTVGHPPNFPGWTSINVASEIRMRLNRPDWPVIVENDANVAGLGSAFFGAGRPHDSFIMVTLGTGVGGAIIYRNRIFRGATGGAGEIGHMTIDYEGPLARSGVAGAIEAYLGQQFLSEHARARLLNRNDSVIHQMTKGDLSLLDPLLLFEAAKSGDEPAREILAWAGHKLGVLLGSAVNLLDIRKIVVGGGVSGAGDFILGPARQALKKYVMPGLQDGLEIIVESHGNDVALAGAAQLIFLHTDGRDELVVD